MKKEAEEYLKENKGFEFVESPTLDNSFSLLRRSGRKKKINLKYNEGRRFLLFHIFYMLIYLDIEIKTERSKKKKRYYSGSDEDFFSDPSDADDYRPEGPEEFDVSFSFFFFRFTS